VRAIIRRSTILSVLFLAGCAGPPVLLTTGTRSLPVEEALVVPAPGTVGALALVERRYTNAVQQDLFLSTSGRTSGQNYLRSQFFGTSTEVDFRDNNLGFRSITTARVSEEMRQELPGIRMARSPYYVQNNYGAFGYAVGRSSASDLCLYAWQQIRSPAGTVSPVANHGVIQVRLRLCQAGATEQGLLSVMYGYTINGTVDAAGWNPYGAPQAVPETLGRPGSPIYPAAPNAPAVTSVITPVASPIPVRRPATAAPPARRRVLESRRPDPVRVSPSATVIVPSPSGHSPVSAKTSSAVPSPACVLDARETKTYDCN
jgi:hypothetical protein